MDSGNTEFLQTRIIINWPLIFHELVVDSEKSCIFAPEKVRSQASPQQFEQVRLRSACTDFGSGKEKGFDYDDNRFKNDAGSGDTEYPRQ